MSLRLAGPGFPGRAFVERRPPKLADVDGVVEVQRAWWLESRDGAPPVLSWFARLAVEVAAAESDGIRVDIRGYATVN
jgi:hypothetical protein